MKELADVQSVKAKELLSVKDAKGKANVLAVMDEVILDVKTVKGKEKLNLIKTNLIVDPYLNQIFCRDAGLL